MNGNSPEARRARVTPERIAKMVAARRAAVPPLAERFWSKVDKSAGPDGCWLFTASLNSEGYGMFWDGKAVRKAHRVSLWLHGIIPETKGDQRGHVADHICRVRNCVNPKHLRIVPAQINSLENSVGPIAKNAAKTHCPRGHPYSGDNLAVLLVPLKRNSRGNPTTRKQRSRVCLTCYPHNRNHPHRIA